MPKLKIWGLVCTLFVLVTINSSAIATEQNEKFDIVGLKLGMTPEEAMQKLHDFGVDKDSISEQRMSYSYSDGINQFQTKEFLYKVSAGKRAEKKGRHSDGFTLYFSPPPKGGHLVGVSRYMVNEIDPVTGGEFKNALIEKYGAVSDDKNRNLQWRFGNGTESCLRAVALPEKNKSILDLVHPYRGGRYRLDLFHVSRIKSLDQCANLLEFQISTTSDAQPAKNVTATMIDIQSWVRAELTAGEEVEKLRQEAVSKREGQGKKPAL